MDKPESITSDGTLKKHPVGVGLLDGLRRTFANFLRHPQVTLPTRKESLRRKNMTLPRLPQSTNTREFDGQILVTERLLPIVRDGDILRHHDQRRFSAFTETPEPVRAEFIQLDKLSGGYGKALPRDARNGTIGHAFCAIPLELDTFCDFCNQPIWGLGWGPVCRRCADCHMTCHWLCAERVIIPCEVSPPSAHTDDDYEFDDENNCADSGSLRANEDEEYRIAANSLSQQKVLRPNTSTPTKRSVSIGEKKELDPRCTSTPFLPKPDGGQPLHHNSPHTLRPQSQFSLFDSADASLKLDETLGEIKEGVTESEQTPMKSTRHQSMLQSRRRHRHRMSSPSSRRHTTGISLLSASTLSIKTYDISSLDQRDIRERGISVWQLSPADAPSTPPETYNKPLPSVVMSSKMQATAAAALTGHQTGTEEITYTKVTIGPRNAALPWKPMELARRLEIFNANAFGLCAKMNPKLPSGDCEGQVRLYINLIRPVRMVLSERPLSIFDIVGGDSDDDEDSNNVERPVETAVKTSGGEGHSNKRVRMLNKIDGHITSFRLPRGSSKLLHVHLSTTASQVIRSLLARFKIDDNPQKFALYEHTIYGESEVSVRKLFDDESPLGLVLQWTLDPSVEVGSKAGEALHLEYFNALLGVKRIVLQENETGDIEWSCFSLAQLRTFLDILNREENDYRRRIELKYQIRKREILRLINLRAKCRQRTLTPNDKAITSSPREGDKISKIDPNSDSSAGNEPDSSRDTDCTESDGTNGVSGDGSLSPPNRPIDLPPPNDTPSPDPIRIAVPVLVSPQKPASSLSSSQVQLLTKAQQKKRSKAAKKGSKKLKGVKNGTAKPKSPHLWLVKKKKNKSVGDGDGVEG